MSSRLTTADLPKLYRLRELLDQQEQLQVGSPLPHQIPPDPPFRLWVLEGGRGAAKSWAIMHYLRNYIRAHPGTRARIIAPTFQDAVQACIKGPSGILKMDSTAVWRPSKDGGSIIEWPNGSECLVLGTPTALDVERLRASGNRDLDIWEEMAANRMLGEAWDQAAFGLREGRNPHSIAATTPRTTKAYRKIRQIAIDAGTITHATMRDNPYLNAEWVADMEAAYAGTRLGRQELLGELLTDIEGALWTEALIDQGRVTEGEVPDLTQIVVAVDPSGGAGDQGIVVVGVSGHHLYVLADRTVRKHPEGWGRAVLAAYDEYSADTIVVERNYGGDMARGTIESVCRLDGRQTPMIVDVTASRGKRVRAEPVASLYGDMENVAASQPKVHHVGHHPALESQMAEWTPDSGDSPDRLDALVWAVTYLTSNMFVPASSWVPGDPI